ncbi:MAG TPA: hypothetical protein VH835_04510, partial [Dongiaceae bacterium]
MVDVQVAFRRAHGPRTQIERRKRTGRLIALAAVGACCLPAWAADPQASGQAWRFSGFGTLGISHSDTQRQWLFARDVSQRGADGATSLLPDSRLGLQLNWQPGSRW